MDKLAASQTLAAALFARPELWPDVCAIVQKSDLSDGSPQSLYAIFQTIAAAGQTPDLETVAARIAVDTQLKTDITAYSALLISKSTENVLYCANLVHNLATAEALSPLLITAGYDLAAPNADLAATLSTVRAALDSYVAKTPTGNAKKIGEYFLDLTASLQTKKSAPLKTGFSDLDDCTGGYLRGDFNVIAARPGFGKTDLAMTLAAKLAATGTATLYESLELYGTDLAARYISDKADIESYKLRDKTLSAQGSPSDWDKFAAVTARDYDLPLIIDERSSLTPQELESQIAKHAPAVVILDNLDLVTPPHKSKDKWRDTEDTTHAIKAIAKRTHTCIVALVQINRSYDTAPAGSAPKMSDLYGGSAIEHDASWVIALTPNQEKTPGITLAHILKSRHGLSSVAVDFSTDYTHHRWTLLDKSH